ncbi:MAG: hypothetical protein GPJ54_03210 [Candidatus Heimdallarchaeota archaeon]|nr:hypothetical protein [Candidatus Heimdallarchaeota archaeon]
MPDYKNITENNALTYPAIYELPMQVNPHGGLSLSQTNFVHTNFELAFFLTSGNRRDESYGLYIKQALAPLGIDVNIFAKPLGQFVGDLVHLTSTGKTWDLSTFGFISDKPTPDLSWVYHSEGFGGSKIMQLGDPNFQAWQLLETGLNQTTDIDPLIKAIDSELDLTRRYELLEEFNDMYFTKLVWNIPLVVPSTRTAMWKGFGGPNNELWDIREGVVGSSWLGAKWDTANIPAQRVANTSTYRVSTGDQRKFNMDPFQVIDSAQATQTLWSNTGNLLMQDGTGLVHPNVAWNWFTYDGGLWDYDNDPSTDGIPTTNYTYLLRNDVYWHETTLMNGTVAPAHAVDGLDYNLTLTMYDWMKNTNLFDTQDLKPWDPIVNWKITSTLFPYDTITIRIPNEYRKPDDVTIYNDLLKPQPAHILGGNLTWLNASDVTPFNVTLPLEVGMPFSAWDTYEWNHFESFEGNTAVGPYQMVDYEYNVFHSFKSRDDYWFPNEWDIEIFYNGTDAELTALEAAYNVDLSMWANGSFPQKAYYHAYGDPINEVKDKVHNLNYIEYVVIDDPNAELTKFESGELDTFDSTSIDATTVVSHERNPNLILKEAIADASIRLLFFNLLHEDLKKINVRLAITHALDREMLINIHDGFARPWWSVADANKQSGGIDWGSIQHPLEYDYARARDLMRLEGYKAADTNNIIPTRQLPVYKDIIDVFTLPLVSTELAFVNIRDFFGVFIGFLLIVTILRKRTKIT